MLFNKAKRGVIALTKSTNGEQKTWKVGLDLSKKVFFSIEDDEKEECLENKQK